MRELILLRHAHAEPGAAGQADFDRPLSSQGLAEAEAAGRWLADQGLVPDRVLCSPARRTRETLEAFVSALRAIHAEALSDPEKVKTAPHDLPVRRLDELTAARNPNVAWG